MQNNAYRESLWLFAIEVLERENRSYIQGKRAKVLEPIKCYKKNLASLKWIAAGYHV